MKRLHNLHPFLFAIAPVLFLYAQNIEQVKWTETIFPTAIVLLGLVVLLLFFQRLTRHRAKAGLLTSLFLLLFFSYGHAYRVIQASSIGGAIIRTLLGINGLFPNALFFLLWGLLFALGAFGILRLRQTEIIKTLLTIAVLTFILISSVRIGLYQIQSWGQQVSARKIVTGMSQSAQYPDIYHIILDGYASKKTMYEVFDFDNDVFYGELLRRGFFIAKDSKTNYPISFLSLASLLNMRYINDLTDEVGETSRDRKIPYAMIVDNAVVQLLKSYGYTFIQFGSGWGPTDKNANADDNIQCGRGAEFQTVFLQQTPLSPIVNYVFGFNTRVRILCTFSTLSSIVQRSGPKYVFAHIMVPHPPYVFGAQGEAVPRAEIALYGEVWSEKSLYVNQVRFVNTKVLDVIDAILAQSEAPPIILIHADHGSESLFAEPMTGGWENPSDAMLQERMGILNALYLPDHREKVYTSISPVNIFRLIFSEYFGLDYPLLEDRSFYSTYEYPYQFTDVTDRL